MELKVCGDYAVDPFFLIREASYCIFMIIKYSNQVHWAVSWCSVHQFMRNIEDNEIWSLNENWVVHCSFLPSHHHHHHFRSDISYDLMRKICSSTWNWVEIGFSMWINTFFCYIFSHIWTSAEKIYNFWLRNHWDIHYNLICSNNFSSVCNVIVPFQLLLLWILFNFVLCQRRCLSFHWIQFW